MRLSRAFPGQAKGKTIPGHCYIRRVALRMAKKNDFSQSEAASKLRISARTLHEWKQGRARP